MRTRNSLSFKALPLARNSREFDAGFGFALNVADVRLQKRRAIKNTIKTCGRDGAFACSAQRVFRANAQYSPRSSPLKRLRKRSRSTRRHNKLGWRQSFFKLLRDSDRSTRRQRNGVRGRLFRTFPRYFFVFVSTIQSSLRRPPLFTSIWRATLFPSEIAVLFKMGDARRKRSLGRQRDGRPPQTRPVGAIGGRGALKNRR